VLGEGMVKDEELSMGGEDFSFFLHRAPGCYIRMGLTEKGREVGVAHSPRYDFNDKAIPYGARIMAGIAKTYLDEND
jgi:hippurate hydrolase